MNQQKRLSLVLLLNLAMIAGLVFVGLTAHSLGVLAAGGDFIADSAAIVLGLIAIHLRNRPHGNPNATSIVALINGLFLLAVSLLVIADALRLLTSHTPHVEAVPVIIISVVSAITMTIGALILGSESGKEDLHMRSVLLDTVSDAASAAAVAV